jgi:RNA polymerase sigma-70 factor, ECF subfamily
MAFNKLNQYEVHTLAGHKEENAIRDDQWVERIINSDKDAFEAIYKSYYPRLFNFLLRYLKSESVIEDIIHNVLFHVWKNRESIEPKGTLQAYLFTSVRNQAFKHLNGEKRFDRNATGPETVNGCHDLNPENIYELNQLEGAYLAAVQKLPEKRRHIFLMHRQEQLTYAEIAQVLNISIKTVETQMSRSLKFLATSLSKFM